MQTKPKLPGQDRNFVTEIPVPCGYTKAIQYKYTEVTSMKYVCDVCGWVYDEAEGYPEGGIAPGTPWEKVPEDFECPLCYVGKDQFSEE